LKGKTALITGGNSGLINSESAKPHRESGSGGVL